VSPGTFAVLVVLFALTLPYVVYICVKLATVAYYLGRDRAREIIERRKNAESKSGEA
jgi:uncharacterized membrane protein